MEARRRARQSIMPLPLAGDAASGRMTGNLVKRQAVVWQLGPFVIFTAPRLRGL